MAGGGGRRRQPGPALLRYRGFQQQGFRIVALIDSDPGKVGQVVDGLTIFPPEHLAAAIAATGTELGLLTVPAEIAQGVADSLVKAGIRGILNFAPTVLRLPPEVSLVSVDLTVQWSSLRSWSRAAANDTACQPRAGARGNALARVRAA